VTRRALTAAAGIVLVLAVVAAPGLWPIWALVALAVAIASIELARLPPQPRPFFALGFLVTLGMGASCIAEGRLSALGALADVTSYYVVLPFTALGIIGASLLRRHPKSWLTGELASAWIAAPLISLAAVHADAKLSGPVGWSLASPLVWILATVWAGDTAGLFVGKAFGKRLLAPQVSPNKTLAGAYGNLGACLLVGGLLAPAFGLSPLAGLVGGLGAGVFGQLGDLFESWLKRGFGKKDSGAWLPGHGGLLDRIDSLLFAAPAMTTALMLWPKVVR
jgi:phosphatidate cytidylyltransferase